MEIIKTIIENQFAVYIHIHNTKTNEEIATSRYQLIKIIDYTKLKEWLDKPIRWTSYNPKDLSMDIYI